MAGNDVIMWELLISEIIGLQRAGWLGVGLDYKVMLVGLMILDHQESWISDGHWCGLWKKGA